MSAPPHINDADIAVVTDSGITALFCDCGAHRRPVFPRYGIFECTGECTELVYIPPAVRSMFTTTTHQDPAARGQKRVRDGANAGQRPSFTTTATCDTCGELQTVRVTIGQTRSADEPATRLFECTECESRWRE